MTTRRKSFELTSFKALDSDGNVGRFKALVSVFGNVDQIGDRVMPGAFSDSLKRWAESGDPIPVIWSHDWGNPFAHIGGVDPRKARETDRGLEVEGEIDLTNPFAAQVYQLMKGRRVKEFSFGYDIISEREADDRANELTAVDLIELGPTLKGMNPDTELVGVKQKLEDAAAEAEASDDDEKEPLKVVGHARIQIEPVIDEAAIEEAAKQAADLYFEKYTERLASKTAGTIEPEHDDDETVDDVSTDDKSVKADEDPGADKADAALRLKARIEEMSQDL